MHKDPFAIVVKKVKDYYRSRITKQQSIAVQTLHEVSKTIW